MRANGGFPCASLLGIVVMGGDATDGGAGDRVPFTHEMPTDPAGGRAPDATLGQYGRRRHHEERKSKEGNEAHVGILESSTVRPKIQSSGNQVP
jgi:hypothetical protein